MVLESLFPAKKIYNKPLDMLILSFIVSLACIFCSYFIFPAYSGIIFTLLIAVAVSPLIYRVFRIEEDIEDAQAKGKINKTFWDRHDEVIKVFSMFFIGNVLAIFLVAVLLPSSFVNVVFAQQFEEIAAIRSIGATGGAISGAFISMIIANNLKVMSFSFLLSFLFGAGALFILSWNASILAIYLAGFLKEGLFSEFFTQTVGIMPHAPIEIFAYFMSGIAGGMLSVGVIREKLNSKEFLFVFKDSFLMLFIAILAVVIGAFVEVGI